MDKKNNNIIKIGYKFIVFLCLILVVVRIGLARDLQTMLYFGYVGKVFNLVKNSYYKKIDEKTLIQGAYDGMKKNTPSLNTPSVFTWQALEAFYMNYTSDNPGISGKLAEAALDGMIDSLDDPYSILLTPDKLKTLKGDGSGIGLELGARKGNIVVIAPVAGSPADKAGFKSGDIIIAVNNQSVKNMSLIEGSLLIAGRQGKKIDITINRGGKTITLSPVFDKLKFEPIKYSLLSGNVGYIRISFFNGKIFNEFIYALNYMKKQNAKGLIVDLRDNPGGDLNEALRIAARFVPDGVLVWVKKEGGEPVPQKSGSNETFPAPVVFLVNRGSASASEVLSAAVSENGKAVLIGQQTFGKGVIQSVFKLTGGAELNLTTQAYLTPEKHNINGMGLKPDYIIDKEPNFSQLARDLQVIAGWKYIKKQ